MRWRKLEKDISRDGEEGEELREVLGKLGGVLFVDLEPFGTLR